MRQEIDRRIQEKEEEFENTRKNQQRALDSMQVRTSLAAKPKPIFSYWMHNFLYLSINNFVGISGGREQRKARSTPSQEEVGDGH